MHSFRNTGAAAALLLFAVASAPAQPQVPPAQATFERVCGGCHSTDIVTAARRSREQWQDTIQAMISKQGAKITAEDSATVLDYLASAYSPASPGAPARSRGGRGRGAGNESNAAGVGADDKHQVDPAGADRGRRVYAAECINCHGTHARGTDRGADLIRSVVVLHDRYGSELGPFLRKGHPTQTTPAANLTSAQIADLSHFVHYEVYQTMRSALDVQNVLTGDAKAGAAYFAGTGKCGSCHSTTGDLAGIGKRYSPVALQQRFLFPEDGGGRRRGAASPSDPSVTVTVTPPSASPVSGVLLYIDDFNVAVRDANGAYHSFRRTPSLQVVRHDPYAAHEALLDTITDRQIHDVVAYLEGLQ